MYNILFRLLHTNPQWPFCQFLDAAMPACLSGGHACMPQWRLCLHASVAAVPAYQFSVTAMPACQFSVASKPACQFSMAAMLACQFSVAAIPACQFSLTAMPHANSHWRRWPHANSLSVSSLYLPLEAAGAQLHSIIPVNDWEWYPHVPSNLSSCILHTTKKGVVVCISRGPLMQVLKGPCYSGDGCHNSWPLLSCHNRQSSITAWFQWLILHSLNFEFSHRATCVPEI